VRPEERAGAIINWLVQQWQPAYPDELKQRIEFIAAEIRTANQDHEDNVGQRLIDWLKDKKPAQLAFTDGPLRQAAYAIEERISAAVEDAKTEGEIEWLKAWNPQVEADIAKAVVDAYADAAKIVKSNPALCYESIQDALDDVEEKIRARAAELEGK